MSHFNPITLYRGGKIYADPSGMWTAWHPEDDRIGAGMARSSNDGKPGLEAGKKSIDVHLRKFDPAGRLRIDRL